MESKEAHKTGGYSPSAV